MSPTKKSKKAVKKPAKKAAKKAVKKPAKKAAKKAVKKPVKKALKKAVKKPAKKAAKLVKKVKKAAKKAVKQTVAAQAASRPLPQASEPANVVTCEVCGRQIVVDSFGVAERMIICCGKEIKVP